MTEQEEKKNKMIALFSTIGVHTVLLFLMFFIVAWRPPNPPFPEYGIEVNLGFDMEGSGDIQPDEPVGTENPTPVNAEESKPEVKEEDQPDVKESAKPVETKAEEEEEVLSSKDESPVTVKEKKADPKPVEKPKEQPKKEEPKKVDPAGVYKPSTTNKDADKKATAGGREGKPGNQGDDVNKHGDKGDPGGTPDAKAYYGKPGGGGGGNGPAIDMYGWDYDNIQEPTVSNEETGGRIVFFIEVDDDGNLIGYRKESSSVSIATERACIAVLEKITFSKKSGAKVPAISKGKITYVILSK